MDDEKMGWMIPSGNPLVNKRSVTRGTRLDRRGMGGWSGDGEGWVKVCNSVGGCCVGCDVVWGCEEREEEEGEEEKER